MRDKIVAGNWKMNLNKDESLTLVDAISNTIGNKKVNCRIIVAPPSINLASVAEHIKGQNLLECAVQNMHHKDSGAYTGEISPVMVKAVDVHIAILGHSERREYFGEDDAFLKAKVDAALEHQMEVIFCFGELLADRKSGLHFKVVESQILNALFELSADSWEKIILAYEPVWAIGTGETATPDQAQEMHAFIRNLVRDKYGNHTADRVSILYGGSVKPDNAKEIFSKSDVDGGLIGGASLKPDDFTAIINAI